MRRDAFFPQKICAECWLKIPCLALVSFFALTRKVFSLQDSRNAWTLWSWVQLLWTGCWVHLHSFRYFQVQILTKLYDKTRVYRGIKAEFRAFIVDFLPFFFWSFVLDWVTSPSQSRNNVTSCLSSYFVLVDYNPFLKKRATGSPTLDSIPARNLISLRNSSWCSFAVTTRTECVIRQRRQVLAL